MLGSYLEAVCVDGIDSVAGLLGSLNVGAVTFFSIVRRGGGEHELVPTCCPVACVDRPASIRCSPASAPSIRCSRRSLAVPTSAANESVITRDGIWIGRDWLRVSRDQDVHAGVIGREQEMRGLRDLVATTETAPCQRR